MRVTMVFHLTFNDEIPSAKSHAFINRSEYLRPSMLVLKSLAHSFMNINST